MFGGSGDVLITGAGQRIGLHLAKAFINAGARVIVTYRTPREEIAALEASGAIAIHADFSSEKGVLAFVECLQGKTNNLRGIIHNASGWVKDNAILTDHQNFSSLVNVHMFAPYWINHHCKDFLYAGEGMADIVSLTDFTVQKGSDKHIAYLATKAAMESMTLSFAKLFSPRVKVNAIAPALIMFNEGDSESYRQDRLKRSALQIEPGPAVVFDAVKYLFCSSYTTGAVIPLNGGRHIM